MSLLNYSHCKNTFSLIVYVCGQCDGENVTILFDPMAAICSCSI
uniref:Uncharacterized protein n=1 Tax=Arundo donax TaxID=35708 RepID=A0A0A8YFC5_ARUDO